MAFTVGEQVVALARIKSSGGNKVRPGWQGHCIGLEPKHVSFSFEIKKDSLFGNIQGFTTVRLSHEDAATKVSRVVTGSSQTIERSAPLFDPTVSPLDKNLSTSEIIDKLTQLKNLKESGILSEEEFNKFKAELIPGNLEEDSKNSVSPKPNNPDPTDISIEDDGSTEWYIWITKKPMEFSAENYGLLFEILDFPKFVEGVKPKHQKDILKERKRLFDPTPLFVINESSMKPARFNRALDLKTASRIIVRLNELGLTAEIRKN